MEIIDVPTDKALDNPAWDALSTRHSHFALGGTRAKRYPPDVAPLAAIDSLDPSALLELAQIVSPGEVVYLVGIVPPLTPDWTIRFQLATMQMTCQRPIEAALTGIDIDSLSEADVPDMLALTALSHTGPFRSRTTEMGAYLGIRVHGQLVAMAGEFLFPSYFREINVVCTHPDFRRQGYARAIVGQLARANLEQGLTPFLFVMPENETAQMLYKSLGFVERRRMPMIGMQRLG